MKGKYANRAALRREDASVQSEIENYKAAVKRVTAELEDVTSRWARETADLRAALHEARHQRDEASSPRVAELEALSNESRAAKIIAERELKLRWQEMCKGADRLTYALAVRFGIGLMDAGELVEAAWFADCLGDRLLSDPAARAIERARRVRKFDDLGVIVSDAPVREHSHGRIREPDEIIAQHHRTLLDATIEEIENAS